KRFQAEVEKLKALHAELSKSVQAVQKLESQMQENKSVQEEMELLGSDAVIYKLEGPVLVKQDTAEALQNVGKRIGYIKEEAKRHEAQIKDLEKKREELQSTLGRLQQQFQQAQVKAAAR
ncbi:hypothetical protein BOX15_Mlig010213g5, partial [Macrostomum lignano]